VLAVADYLFLVKTGPEGTLDAELADSPAWPEEYGSVPAYLFGAGDTSDATLVAAFSEATQHFMRSDRKRSAVVEARFLVLNEEKYASDDPYDWQTRWEPVRSLRFEVKRGHEGPSSEVRES
jgi:hypothetical protein